MDLKSVKWKKYLLCKLFKIDYGSKWDIGKTTRNNPKYAFVSRSEFNNGVSCFVDEIPNLKPYKAGAITLALGGSIGACFLQNFDFYTSQNVAVIQMDDSISNNAKLFVTKAINNECKNRYQAFGRELNSHIKKDLSVYLPYLNDVEPDWDFMNKYIDSLKKEALSQLDNIIKICANDNKTIRIFSERVNSNDFNKWAGFNNTYSNIKKSEVIWKKYKIGFLFDTFTGGDLILNTIKDGEIPVITHSASNNSISAYSSLIPNQKLFDHNITISLADRGTFFSTIQNQDFYIGTRVKALVAKFKCNPYILVFISTVINHESFRFNYGRNCTGGLDELVISLPSKPNNKDKFSIQGFTPDWEYMEEYIKSLPYSKRI